jgi:NADP-dependent aldehyde dehydrogenase
MKLSGLSILGQNRTAAAGAPQSAVNPATGLALGPDYFWATAADVDAAAQLAAAAFREFRCWPARRREDFLRHIAGLLEANAADIIARAHQETALPASRLQGELARTCFQLRFYGEAGASGMITGARMDQGDPHRRPLPKPDLRSMMVPLGPVAVFSASNFPLAYSVAGGDTASALAAGCPVIVKPHQGHLGTSELVGLLVQQAARDCDAPAGVFSMLYGEGREIGLALVRHPLIKAVGFTGSRTGGRALMDAAAARPEPIPVYAEMGSVNPLFMFAGQLDRKAEELAAGLHGSVTLGVGQFCTNPGLVFVESGTGAGTGAKRFLAQMATLVAATPPGTMLTAGLCSAYRAGVEKFKGMAGVRLAAQASANTSANITADIGPGAAQAGAALFVTSADVFRRNDRLMDEVFGPSTLVVECSSPEEMRQLAGGLEGQLTATIHATPEELAANQELIELLTLKAGRLICNGFPTGVEVAHAMTHGGPYPATSDGRSSSVGSRAIERFVRLVSFQNFPGAALPPELQTTNPLGIKRRVNGKL